MLSYPRFVLSPPSPSPQYSLHAILLCLHHPPPLFERGTHREGGREKRAHRGHTHEHRTRGLSRCGSHPTGTTPFPLPPPFCFSLPFLLALLTPPSLPLPLLACCAVWRPCSNRPARRSPALACPPSTSCRCRPTVTLKVCSRIIWHFVFPPPRLAPLLNSLLLRDAGLI